MVLLDHSLIYGARRIMTGANIHQVGTLVFCYEQAVALHNGGYKGHRNYQRKHEDLLRQYVADTLPAVLRDALNEETKTLLSRG